MSSTTNLQNVLANVVRPVYVYDSATSNYSTKVVISNVGVLSADTLEIGAIAVGDARGNLYLGNNAGSDSATSARTVGVGVEAARNNTGTTDSVFLGYRAGGSNIADVSGTIAIGSSSRAGGSSNIYVGTATGSSSGATGNIFIGHGITTEQSSFDLPVSNQIRIGRGSNIPLSAAINTTGSSFVGVNTLSPLFPLHVTGSDGQIPSTTCQLSDGTRAAVRVTRGTTAADGLSLFQSSSEQGLSATNTLRLTFSTSNTTRMTIEGDGRIAMGSANAQDGIALVVGGTTSTTALIVTEFLRNAVVPSEFDISGGTMFLSNRVLTGAGTAAAPAYSFAGDLAVGVFDPASNVLGFATAGLERLRVASNGFVGIGTSAPEFLLDVSGSVRATNFVGTTGSTTFGGVLLNNGAVAVSNGSVSVPTVTFQNDLSLGLFRTGANQLGFVSAGLPRMTLSNGNLGIGTATPAQSLDVSGTTQTSNLVVPGVLRNALIATQFDISGGNISNSATTRSSNFIGTAGANNSIGGVTLSNTNLTFAGSITGSTANTSNVIGGVTLSNALIRVATPGNATSTGSIEVGAGATSDGLSGSPFLALQIAAGGFRHFIRSRHNVGSNNGNAVDFFTNSSATGTTSTAPGTGNALAMSVTSGGVGVGTAAPAYQLDVSGAARTTSNMLVSGRIGIGTLTPVTRLQVNERIIDDNNYAYDTSAAMIIQPRFTSDVCLNDPTPVLYLGRQGISGAAFGAMSTFRLSRFEHNDTNSRTRMDITMTHGAFGLSEPTIMTMRSDGRVGVGTTVPGYRLDVSEGSSLASINMSTWPRQSVSNVLIVRGVNSSPRGQTINWSNVQQSMSASLITFVASNSSDGMSFRILRSGVWSISYQYSTTASNSRCSIDVADFNDIFTSSSHQVLQYDFPVRDLDDPGIHFYSGRWTGYLPSNDGLFYKTRQLSGTSMNDGLSNSYLQIVFLYETPNAGGNFPLP